MLACMAMLIYNALGNFRSLHSSSQSRACFLFIDPKRELILYLRLSQAFKERRKMQDRDKALVIGGTCASLMQMKAVENFCRSVILQRNHGHMLKRWDSITEALEYEDFHLLLKQIKKKYPEDVAEDLLEEFDYRCRVKISDHKSNESFAAAVLGIEYDWMIENFGE
jgi:hypothetical protein